MRENGKGRQEGVGGSGLESWQAGRQTGRRVMVQGHWIEKKQLVTSPNFEKSLNISERPEV